MEFIYAQSPGNTKGLLIGMLFASEGMAMGLSAILTLVVSKLTPTGHFCSFFGNARDFYLKVLDKSSECWQGSTFVCSDGVLFVYLVLALIAIIFAVLFCVGAILYKHRRRDQDPYMPIWFMEDRETGIRHMIRRCCC